RPSGPMASATRILPPGTTSNTTTSEESPGRVPLGRLSFAGAGPRGRGYSAAVNPATRPRGAAALRVRPRDRQVLAHPERLRRRPQARPADPPAGAVPAP